MRDTKEIKENFSFSITPSLIPRVDKHWRGHAKYRSRSDFVEKACEAQIQRDLSSKAIDQLEGGETQ